MKMNPVADSILIYVKIAKPQKVFSFRTVFKKWVKINHFSFSVEKLRESDFALFFENGMYQIENTLRDSSHYLTYMHVSINYYLKYT